MVHPLRWIRWGISAIIVGLNIAIGELFPLALDDRAQSQFWVICEGHWQDITCIQIDRLSKEVVLQDDESSVKVGHGRKDILELVSSFISGAKRSSDI